MRAVSYPEAGSDNLGRVARNQDKDCILKIKSLKKNFVLSGNAVEFNTADSSVDNLPYKSKIRKSAKVAINGPSSPLYFCHVFVITILQLVLLNMSPGLDLSHPLTLHLRQVFSQNLNLNTP